MRRTAGEARLVLFAALGVLVLVIAIAAWMFAATRLPDSYDGLPPAAPTVAGGATDSAGFAGPAGTATGTVPREAGRLAEGLAEAAGDATAIDATPDLPGEPCALRGRVVDDAGRPLPDALVLFWPSDAMRKELGLPSPLFFVDEDFPWDALPQARTDRDGRFAFDARELPAAGGATVDVTTGGRTSFSDPLAKLPWLLVEHAAFETTGRRCMGYHAGSYDFGDFAVSPGASLAARVVDEDDRPLAGAEVSCEDGRQSWDSRQGEWDLVSKRLRATSDAAGRLRLDGLWPGVLRLSFTAERRDVRAREATLTAGQVTDLGEVVLPLGGTFSGQVVTAAGLGVPGAELKVRPTLRTDVDGPDMAAVVWGFTMRLNGRIQDQTRFADGAGMFRVEGISLETDDWEVLARAPGFDVTGLSGLKPGASDLRLVLLPQAEIRLSVHETRADGSEGPPVAGATVKARRLADVDQRDWSASIEVVPDGDVLRLLGAGRVRTEAVVSAPGHATQGFVLPGTAPGEILEQVVRLPRESVLAGRVHDPDGAPVPGAKVTLKVPQTLRVNQPDRTTRTDAEGRFGFHELQRGDWQLDVAAPGFLPLPEPRTVTVKPATAIEDLDLELARGGRVEGLVTDADGAPAGGRTVSAQLTTVAQRKASKEVHVVPKGADAVPEYTYKCVTDGEGRFVLDGLPPDSWTLSCDPGASAVARVEVGETATVALVLHRRPRLVGHVFDRHGPVPGATVQIDEKVPWADGWMELDKVVADGSGAFDYESPYVGTFHVSADSGGAATPAEDVALDWDVVRDVVLRFGGGRLSGVVVSAEDGTPLAGATVRAMRQLAKDEPRERNGDPVTTDAQGRFAIERLPPGTWMVQASADGRRGSPLTGLDLGEGGTRDDLRLELARSGTLVVTLRNSAGSFPASRVRIVIRSADGALNSARELSPPKTGEFTQKLVPVGLLSVRVERSDGPKTWVPVSQDEVTIEAGRTAERSYVVDP